MEAYPLLRDLTWSKKSVITCSVARRQLPEKIIWSSPFHSRRGTADRGRDRRAEDGRRQISNESTWCVRSSRSEGRRINLESNPHWVVIRQKAPVAR